MNKYFLTRLSLGW